MKTKVIIGREDINYENDKSNKKNNLFVAGSIYDGQWFYRSTAGCQS